MSESHRIVILSDGGLSSLVAVKFWGLIALTIAATAMVPVIFILFIIISWPF